MEFLFLKVVPISESWGAEIGHVIINYLLDLSTSPLTFDNCILLMSN